MGNAIENFRQQTSACTLRVHALVLAALCALAFTIPVFAHAQVLHQDIQGVWRAQVVAVLESDTVRVPGTDVESAVQTLRVELLSGERVGEEIEFVNDFIQLDEGDTFFLNYLVTVNGDEFYSVREVDRRGAMALLFALFVAVIVGFGGWQGVRSLLSLAGSLLVIAYVLVPQLVAGVSPVPLSIAVAGLVLFFAIFFTHGFNIRSAIAYAGTMTAVFLTGLLAFFTITGADLTGFSSDATVYLNLSTGGELDFVGLLLAAVIIGALGVLDDIAVTQVAVVRELVDIRTLGKWEIYHKAMRVGREHVGALVNTLVLAYTGAALPLLLFFSVSDTSVLTIINREIFATEIIRSLIGSIGLILAVPITTLLAVVILHRFRDRLPKDDHGHSHGHSHAH